MLEKLTGVQPRELRWPQLKVNAELSAAARPHLEKPFSLSSVFPVIP